MECETIGRECSAELAIQMCIFIVLVSERGEWTIDN